MANEKVEDVVSTPEAREKAASEVMYPEMHARVTEFMGRKIQLRALPIFYARKVSTKLDRFKSVVAEVSAAAESNKPMPALDLDDATIDALLEASVTILAFYKVDISKEEIEKEVSVEDLAQFIQAQLEVSGKSDFLLTPLRAIIKLTSLAEDAAGLVDRASIEESPKLSPTVPSANPGE